VQQKTNWVQLIVISYKYVLMFDVPVNPYCL